MSLNVRKLQSLYKSDALSRAIIDTLGEEGASQVPEVTEFGGGSVYVPAFAGLDERKRTLAIIKALKTIEKTGCGTFIPEGNGGNSRMSWDLEPEEIYAFATGGGEPLVELEVATLPEHDPVRRGRATLRFPNLDTCVQFFSSTKSWPAPVVAAAQAGLWKDDVAPPEWQRRLDRLERALEGVRHAAPEPPPGPARLTAPQPAADRVRSPLRSRRPRKRGSRV